MPSAQTFSIDELCGVVRIAERERAGEIRLSDCRPDAPRTLVELDPDTPRAQSVVIDGEGFEVDPFTVPA